MGSKADAYLALEPLALQGHLELLDHRELVRELSLLERVYHPGGRVTVDHPRGQHDDHANALALAVLSAWRRRRREADEESMRPEGSFELFETRGRDEEIARLKQQALARGLAPDGLEALEAAVGRDRFPAYLQEQLEEGCPSPELRPMDKRLILRL